MPFIPTNRLQRRMRLKNSRPNFSAQRRTLSWLTSTPRAASISSTIRRLKGKR